MAGGQATRPPAIATVRRRKAGKPKFAEAKPPVKRLPVVAPLFSAQVLGRRLNEIAKRADIGRVPWRGHTGRRPLILQESVRQTVVAALRQGTFLWVAAVSSGITERTLAYWLQKGRDGIEPYVQFFHDVEQAMGLARLSAETRVFNNDPKTWLRLGPGRDRPGRPGWTEETRIEHSGPEGGPIEHEITHKLNDDELREVARIAGFVGLLEEGTPSEASTEADEVHSPQTDS